MATMNKIGFSSALQRAGQVVEPVQTYSVQDAEKILHAKGYQEVSEILRQYLFNEGFTRLGTDEEQEQARLEQFCKKIQKIKMRYFEPI